MLLRFRTRDGMKRVPCDGNDTIGLLVKGLLGEGEYDDSITINNKPGDSGSEKLSMIGSQTVNDLGLKHGDIVYVNLPLRDTKKSGESPPQEVRMKKDVQELPIDIILDQEEGLIPRSHTPLCKHGEKGMCEYCCPLPPWDSSYHETHKIKHISFHSFLKRVSTNNNANVKNGGSYVKPIQELNYKMDTGCDNGHEPWPHGICSRCQPSAITLKQQDFRMVDHIEFSRYDMINEFIDSWRTSGRQRIGYMYGRYDRYDLVPLGIKTICEFIYEPMQFDEDDGITMDMEEVRKEMDGIDKFAKEMGLYRIGVIFTDLIDSGHGDGSVICKRHRDSYFLTCLEVMMSAQHQLKDRNPCQYSQDNTFGSKFVTCCVSGNLNGDIDIFSYQVSREAEALVDAGMICGSTHPSMAYINETTRDRYVPEIFYMRKNEYGLTVKENAKPAFPVEYLLVTLTHGFPLTKSGSQTITFPRANRESLGQSQDYDSLKRTLLPSILAQDDYTRLQETLRDYHMLIYLQTLEILTPQEFTLLLKATQSMESLYLLTTTPGWQTLCCILQETE